MSGEGGIDNNLSEGQILEGYFWPEKVKITGLKKVGTRFKIDAEGLKSQKRYTNILDENDLKKVKRVEEGIRDFTGDPYSFLLFIEGMRIRYAYQFDPLYAVHVSKIDPLPHQIDAVYHYILRQPKIRFLLADDPGAGKTIMAGLVLKELKQRGLVNRVLIVVPGHLKDQWRRELKEKFNETFKIVDRGVMNASWGENVWQEDDQVITSMDFAKQDYVRPSLSEIRWDLVIVDEAHKMAAYEYGGQVKKTDRYKLGELLSENSNFLLLLTATPHRGDPKNFRMFLDLLEPDLFATEYMLEESITNRDNPLFLRRLKEDLKDFNGRPLFPPRKVVTVKYRLSDYEKRLYNAVTEYVEKYYNKAMQKYKRNVAFALLILQRRLASSVRAVRKSLERRMNRLKELHKNGEIISEKGYIDEEDLEDSPERERLEDELVENLTSAETLEELAEEIRMLEELIRLAKEAEREEIETKLSELKKVMDKEELKQKGDKLLIFTESKDTLEYLVEKIKSWGYSVTSIHGGMDIDKRIAAEHEFRDKAQIMVSTDAGGEGINLQFCWLMVNYDIPWNPNRLEQRMGRIHRYGQRYEVYIYNLVATDTKEGKVLYILLEKLDTIRKQLGSDRVFDVIGNIVSERMLRDLIVDAITNKRSMDEILSEIKSIRDEEAIRRVNEAIGQSLAIQHIDLTRILDEQRVAKENRLVPEYIEKFFLKAAEKLGVKVDKRKDGFWKVSSVPYELRNLPFEFKTKFGEVYKEYERFSFDKEQAFKGQAEFVAPGHPLLEAVIENIFEKYSKDVERGAVFLDPSGKMDGFVWFIEGKIMDGTGSIAGERIFAIYQDSQGNIQPVQPSVLWDLKPHKEAVRADQIPDEERVKEFVVDILYNYLKELKDQRLHYAEIKRKYGLRSLEYQISDSERKLIDYEMRKAEGENIPEATIQNEFRNKERLLRRKEQLEKQIEYETSLSLSDPKIIGVVGILPNIMPDDTLREDAEVERIGMELAMEFEISKGRSPEDVSAQHLGFDIRSKALDGSIRYIEVKARAREGKIALTPNEWMIANRLGDEYWLYVVVNAKDKPELYTIQNPAKNLKPEEEVEVVRYIISDWKRCAVKEV